MSRISSSGGCYGLIAECWVEMNWTYLRAHLEFDDLYLVCNNWWFVALVEGSVEHLDGIEMELV
jgi:hypothetical protein